MSPMRTKSMLQIYQQAFEIRQHSDDRRACILVLLLKVSSRLTISIAAPGFGIFFADNFPYEVSSLKSNGRAAQRGLPFG